MSGFRYRPNPEVLAGGPPRPTRRLTTSRTELVHLAIAFFVLTIDIALIRGEIPSGGSFGSVNPSVLLAGVGVSAVAALTGFVAHEMAHKVAAQRLGFWAEFRMSPVGLLFSLATALFGFLFALPGATVIGGMGDVREWGRTSVAGPLTNLVFGAGFLGASLLSAPLLHSSALWSDLTYIALVNGIFAAFNLLPFGPLDGRKVLRWRRSIWVAAFGASVLFAFGVLFVLFFVTPAY